MTTAREKADAIMDAPGNAAGVTDLGWRVSPDAIAHRNRIEAALLAEREAGRGLSSPTMAREVWRHVKTNKLYELREEDAFAILEVDLTPFVIYRSLDDGRIWLRPAAEFYDGRFVKEKNSAALSAPVGEMETTAEERADWPLCADTADTRRLLRDIDRLNAALAAEKRRTDAAIAARAGDIVDRRRAEAAREKAEAELEACRASHKLTDDCRDTLLIEKHEAEAAREKAVAALREIATTPLEKDFDRDDRGEIVNGSSSYGRGFIAQRFQEIARAALNDGSTT